MEILSKKIFQNLVPPQNIFKGRTHIFWEGAVVSGRKLR
jgi:hypothetical protein